MPLVNTAPLLARAKAQNRAVGAFSVAGIAMVMGVLRAAEQLRTPVILQVAEARLAHSPLHMLGPAMVGAAKAAKVDVAVHLDHGKTLPVLHSALKLGFTSVMLDASALPLAENIQKTQQAAALARRYGADIEAEIGCLGTGEDGTAEGVAACTRPAQALRFWREAGPNALAVAIGNSHGHYTQPPRLRLDVLEEIARTVPCPLVLHGGSGLTGQDFKNCIARGVRKINIATASFNAAASAAKAFAAAPTQGYWALAEGAVEAVRAVAAAHIQIFNGDTQEGHHGNHTV